LSLAGLAFQSRRSAPMAGTSSCASSRNTGRSASSRSSCSARLSLSASSDCGSASSPARSAA
jgi:hypothetical protein